MNQKLIETLSKYNTIILVGGGTGGHIQPIVSLTRHLKNTDKIPNFLWIGGSDSQEQKMAREEHITFFQIPTLKLATTRSFRILLYPVYLIMGFWRAGKIIRAIKNGGKIMNSGGLGRGTVGDGGIKEIGWAERTSFSLPNSFGTFSTKSTGEIISEIKTENKNLCIFSKGGPGSVAIGIAAWLLSVPVYIHESDTIPGRSNRILGKIATKIFLGFEGARQYFNSTKCEVIGQILDPIFSKPTILPTYQPTITWKTSKPHIIVICGSQGSRAIFESIIDQFSANKSYEWIIALGKLNTNMVSQFQDIPDCQALDWISQENMAHLIQDADIAITRGSATTLAELTAFNPTKPHLIVVPLPYSAENHQYYNAVEYEHIGHTLVEQTSLNQLTEIINNLTKYEGSKSKSK